MTSDRGSVVSQPVRSRRRILCVFPAYTSSFGTFEYAYALRGGVRAFMPPQGILVVAAYLPTAWDVRFIDENIRPARARDFLWADWHPPAGAFVERNAGRTPLHGLRGACRGASRPYPNGQPAGASQG